MVNKSLAAVSLATAAAWMVAAPANAEDMVSASDLPRVLETLREAGYEATIETYDDGKREITLEIGNWYGAILPADCDKAEETKCDTLVLSVGFDRKTPMPVEQALAANRDYRYISVWLDDEGDPYAQWAILTREVGIPKEVFLNALVRFAGVVNDFGGGVFDDDNPAEDAAEAATETEAVEEAAAESEEGHDDNG